MGDGRRQGRSESRGGAGPRVPSAAVRRAALTASLVLVAAGLGACGQSTAAPDAAGPGRYSSQPYNPVTGPLRCLREAGLRAHHAGRDGIQIVPRGAGPRIVFAATPGDAQAAQLHGQAEGAEVIGNALLYPNGAPDDVLKKVETCLAGSGLS